MTNIFYFVDFHYDLSHIRTFIEKIGREILTLQSDLDALTITVKEDGSKVSNADYHSHDRLSYFLSQNYPYPIVSEEQENPPVFPKETVWLLDPIDGTSGYIKGKKDYAIMLALVHDCRPVMSMIYIPARRLGYYAEEGKGSYRFSENEKEVAIEVDLVTPISERTFLLSSIKNYAREYNWFAEKNIHKYDIRGGIGIKLSAIAEGESHYYLNATYSLKIWDIIPPVLLVREAGAWVSNAQGGEVVFDETGYNLSRGLWVAPDQALLPYLEKKSDSLLKESASRKE